MAEKALDFAKTVFELCSGDPEIAEILKECGFSEITKPGMLHTAGRFMTIPKGARMKGIDLEAVKGAFAERGYAIAEGGLT
ncbi:MAG: DUF1858 domain-containing protein [Clostridiales bacterium]|nr:DUF1858 domain-containing protein [Clostridiales bacterium]